MKTSMLLCGLCLLPLLAWAHAANAQAPSPYPTPAARTTSPQSSAAASAAGGQCTGAPAGATLVSQGKGNIPAPRGGQPAYSQVPLNLANYAVGGLLTIQIAAGNGGAATFELFSGGTAFPSNGAPSTQPIVTQANVAGGSCAAITLNFSQAGSFILAATSSSGSSSFQYAAYVQPSFAGVFQAAPSNGTGAAPAAPAARPASPAPVAQPSSPVQSATTQGTPSQGSSMFNGVFSPTPAATQVGTGQPTSPAQPVAAAGGQPAPAGVSQVQSAVQAQAPAAQSPSSPDPSQPSSPSSDGTPLMIQAVTIQNSPGVPDTGGHCIICGLVTGNLTAVEPNLVICVTPSGRTDDARSCTGICNPGHDCHAPLERQVMLLSSSHAVHIEILDNDKQGKVQQLAAFDESDATQCTTDQPCMANDSDAQNAGTLVSFEFGKVKKVEGCDASTSGSIWGAEPVLVASTTYSASLFSVQTSTYASQSASQGIRHPGCSFTFTSYSGAIASEQLYAAFASLWGQDGYQGSQLFRNQIGTIPPKTHINVLVVDKASTCMIKGATDCYATLKGFALNAYGYYGQHNQEAAGQGLGYVAPGSRVFNPDAFAYTVSGNKDHTIINVIISAEFLKHGQYKVGENTFANLPIQLTLAYEIGSNVVGLTTVPNFTENSHQTTTNCIMKEAFPSFPLNVSVDARDMGTNGDATIYQDFATSADVQMSGNHGIIDEFAGSAYIERPGVDPPAPTTLAGDGQPAGLGTLSFFQPAGQPPQNPPEVNPPCGDVPQSHNAGWVGKGPYEVLPIKPVPLGSAPPDNQPQNQQSPNSGGPVDFSNYGQNAK